MDRKDQSDSPNCENTNNCKIIFQSLKHGPEQNSNTNYYEYDYIPFEIQNNNKTAFQSEFIFEFPETKYFNSKEFKVKVQFKWGPQDEQ